MCNTEHDIDLLLCRIYRHASGAPRGALSSSQRLALSYFYRANRISRTISGLAAFSATTAGTASILVDSLERNGYVIRRRTSKDRRTVEVELTERGQELGRHGPSEQLARALTSLDAASRAALKKLASRLLADMASSSGRPRFGICGECDHLLRGAEHTCALYDIKLASYELEQLCIKFVGPSRPNDSCSER